VADDRADARRYFLGRAIFARRKARGWSQDELAQRIGWDRKSVGRLENGVHAVTIDRLWRITDELEVTLADLEADAAEIARRRRQPPAPPAPTR
jgi:transcriptional regulator with XRE-family HTH domain